MVGANYGHELRKQKELWQFIEEEIGDCYKAQEKNKEVRR
jgi:hypothetical protein